MMKKKILTIMFLIWIALWAYFIARGLFKNHYFNDYILLSSRSLEGKRAYVTGERFYEFLTFCNKSLPAGATYAIEGIEYLSIDEKRAIYYLYPHLPSNRADFILVFDCKYAGEGYEFFAKLDDSRYILSATPAIRKGPL